VTETASLALRAAAKKLLAANIDTAQLDAEVLMAHCLHLDRADMLLRARDVTVNGLVLAQFEAMIARRATHEPVAYITGEKEFWSLMFEVGPGVLIPRPDSELLIDTARTRVDAQATLRILDIGTGPGTLLLALLSEFSNASGTGIDISDTALDFARRNATRLGFAARADFIANNWLDGLTGKFDLILCNPPYIGETERAFLMPDVAGFEPDLALFGGHDGLDAYRILVPQLPNRLAAGGIALLEIGRTQGPDLIQLAEIYGLYCDILPDLAGHPRCCVLAPAGSIA
jgi:release factor glutamine methyltransferase